MQSNKERSGDKGFTKLQCRQIYKMILDSIDNFMQENNEELSLLKNTIMNPHVNKFLHSLKFPQMEEEENLKNIRKKAINRIVKPITGKVPKSMAKDNRKINIGISQEAPVVSPRKMHSRNIRVTQTTRDTKRQSNKITPKYEERKHDFPKKHNPTTERNVSKHFSNGKVKIPVASVSRVVKEIKEEMKKGKLSDEEIDISDNGKGKSDIDEVKSEGENDYKSDQGDISRHKEVKKTKPTKSKTFIKTTKPNKKEISQTIKKDNKNRSNDEDKPSHRTKKNHKTIINIEKEEKQKEINTEEHNTKNKEETKKIINENQDNLTDTKSNKNDEENKDDDSKTNEHHNKVTNAKITDKQIKKEHKKDTKKEHI